MPQSSTGFSPFELLYGRDVRGPLDILRETWEASPKSEETVVSHVLETQRRLKEMADIVEENLVIRQGAQKQWYDKRARLSEFKSGDPVLVLPTTTDKLTAQWQGPYQVLERKGKVTYSVDIHDKRKRTSLPCEHAEGISGAFGGDMFFGGSFTGRSRRNSIMEG